MKKSRFTETQIVSILKEADAGLSVQDLCRKHSITTATYYTWKWRYGDLDASELKRIKELEAEIGTMSSYETAERAIDEAIAAQDTSAILRVTFDTDVPSPELLAWAEKPLRHLGNHSIRECLATPGGRAQLHEYLLQLEFGILP